MLFRLALLICLPASLSFAQIPFEARQIDDLGKLGTYLDDRKEVDLGIAQARLEGDNRLLIEGVDDEGWPWQVHMPVYAGNATARVLAADFDANGRQDLLITTATMGNGRCIDGGEVTTLLMDDRGRPIPWRTETLGLLFDKEHAVALLDQDGDGRAELLTHGCRYSEDSLRHGEDRYLLGLYEAGDAHWERRPIEFAELYVELEKRRLGDYGGDWLLWMDRPESVEVDDMHAGWRAAPSQRLSGLVQVQFGCEAGLVKSDDSYRRLCPFEEQVWLRYSDGAESRSQPYVVIDQASGREVWLERFGEALDRVLASGLAVRTLGGVGRSAALLWLEAERLPVGRSISVHAEVIGRRATPMELISLEEWEERRSARMERSLMFSPQVLAGSADDSRVRAGTGIPGTGQLSLGGSVPPPSELSPFQWTLGRGGRCFGIEKLKSEAPTVVALDDCTALGNLTGEANSGARVVARSGSPSYSWRPSEGAVVTREFGVRRTRTLHWQGMETASLTAFADVYPVSVSQWESSGETWIVVHGRDVGVGAPLTVDGELIDSDDSRGLMFLRWQDGVPVERIDVALRLVRTRR